MRIRLYALAAAAFLALTLAPAQAQAQIKFGAHVAQAQDLPQAEIVGGKDGSYGLGARIGFDPPMIPLSFYGTVDYFFPDCGDFDCGYQNLAVDANFSPLPFPVLDIYASGGLLIRRTSVEGEDQSATGYSLGGGVALNFIASAYLEVRRELFSEDDGGNQTLIRLGILF